MELLKEKIVLYIQVVKLVDGKKELDDDSKKTLSDRYQRVFGEKYNDEIPQEEMSEKIISMLEADFSKEPEAVYIALTEIFNEDHRKPRTAQVNRAISYEADSIVREILQNVYDCKYDENLKVRIALDPVNHRICFNYNEKGFDWKSLIFYFNAGDNAKGEGRTGKFGLGIKSVMYNVMKMTVHAKGPDGKGISWEVNRTLIPENRTEVKKSLNLSGITSTSEMPEGTSVTITLPPENYSEIEAEIQALFGGMKSEGQYIDLPELTFAFVQLCERTEKTVEFSMGEQRLCWQKGENHIKVTEALSEQCISFFVADCSNCTYVERILVLEKSDKVYDNSRLYATYKMNGDRTFGGAKGAIFVSVKSDYVESNRRILRNADEVREKVKREAEEKVLSCFLTNEKNKKLLAVELRCNDNIVSAEYSYYLEKVLGFIQEEDLRQKIGKAVTLPGKMKKGEEVIPVNYFHHSDIAKFRYSKYAESSSQHEWQFGVVSYRTKSLHDEVDKLLRRIVGKTSADKCVVVMDMYNAVYMEKEKLINFSDITYYSNYRLNDSFKQYVKEIAAVQIGEFKERRIYGYGGNSFGDLPVKDMVCFAWKDFCSDSSQFSLLNRIAEASDNKGEMLVFKDRLQGAFPRELKAVEPQDLEVYDKCTIQVLKDLFQEEIAKLREQIQTEEIGKNPDITFNEIIEKYSELWQKNPNMVRGKRMLAEGAVTLADFIEGDTGFLSKLQVLADENSRIENFEARLQQLLKNIYLFRGPRNEKYSLNNENIVGDFKEKNKTGVAWVYVSKNGKLKMNDFKNCLDDVLSVFFAEPNVKGYKMLANLQTNIVYSDQLPMFQKIAYPLKKSEYLRIREECKRREQNTGIRRHRDRYKAILLKDISTPYFGNGYCCCVKNCDFSITNYFAYEALEIHLSQDTRDGGMMQWLEAGGLVCKNHEALLRNGQDGNIRIINISFGDMEMREFSSYLKELSDDEYIPGKYRVVKLHYIERYRAEIFDPNKENDNENEEDREVTRTIELELSPIAFSYWLKRLLEM